MEGGGGGAGKEQASGQKDRNCYGVSREDCPLKCCAMTNGRSLLVTTDDLGLAPQVNQPVIFDNLSFDNRPVVPEDAVSLICDCKRGRGPGLELAIALAVTLTLVMLKARQPRDKTLAAAFQLSSA